MSVDEFVQSVTTAFGPAFERGKFYADETYRNTAAAVQNLAPVLGWLQQVFGMGSILLLCVLCVALLVLILRHCCSTTTSGKPLATVRHILCETEEMAVQMKTMLSRKQGDRLLSAFADFALKHSACMSGTVGGALGSLEPGSKPPAFDAVVWAAPLMEVQGPVQTDAGYHLILVLHRSGGLQIDHTKKSS